MEWMRNWDRSWVICLHFILFCFIYIYLSDLYSQTNFSVWVVIYAWWVTFMTPFGVNLMQSLSTNSSPSPLSPVSHWRRLSTPLALSIMRRHCELPRLVPVPHPVCRVRVPVNLAIYLHRKLNINQTNFSRDFWTSFDVSLGCCCCLLLFPSAATSTSSSALSVCVRLRSRALLLLLLSLLLRTCLGHSKLNLSRHVA